MRQWNKNDFEIKKTPVHGMSCADYGSKHSFHSIWIVWSAIYKVPDASVVYGLETFQILMKH